MLKGMNLRVSGIEYRMKFLLSLTVASFVVFLILSEYEILITPLPESELRDDVAIPESEQRDDDTTEECPKRDEAFVINQPGCRIPSMSVFTPYANGSAKSARCEYRKGNLPLPPLVIDDPTSLKINQSALKYYNRTRVICRYRGFRRPPLINDLKGPMHRRNIESVLQYSTDWKPLDDTRPTIIASELVEFVEVRCADAEENISGVAFYRDFFAFVPRKKEVEKRCNSINNDDFRTESVNVMLVGLDSLSRLNFRRQMPMSHAYLNEQMAAIEMYGYNKVGDNTYPNLVPVLTGQSDNELLESCLNNSFNNTFDDCPFAWDTFRSKGYRTVFAEDTPNLNLFSYRIRKGFLRQPTDYYLRPFYVAAEAAIGFNKPLNCLLCLGSRLSLSVLLEYAVKHVRVWKENERFFGFFWSTSYTHDFLRLNPEGDAAVLKFLKSYDQSDASNNTVLIMISDHGLRWGRFRETYQGRLEERLPLLMFVLPKWFERRYRRAVSNLRCNQATLTTHFDLHETLLDLAHLERIEDNAIVERQREESETISRSRSLFLRTDAERTCEKAEIPSSYCTCSDQVQHLSTEDIRSLIAALTLVNHINDLLADSPKCARLSIMEISQSSIEVGGSLVGSSELTTLMRFIVTVRLSPGRGLYEGTLEYSDIENAFNVVGTVSRINEYGLQSYCVDDPKLQLYCYCKKQRSK